MKVDNYDCGILRGWWRSLTQTWPDWLPEARVIKTQRWR